MANVYVVKGSNGAAQRLVRAANKAQALRYVAEQTLTADVATADDVYRLATAQVRIEEAETVRDLAAEAQQAAERG
jgi:hypothetical protein